jgi:hypothetical protein
MRAAQASSGLEVPLDRNSFLPVRVIRPFAATSDLPFAAAESLCATSESPCAAPTSSRIEIRLTNGVCIFVPDADSGLLNTVISAVGRLSALPGGEAHEHDVLTEDMAC